MAGRTENEPPEVAPDEVIEAPAPNNAALAKAVEEGDRPKDKWLPLIIAQQPQMAAALTGSDGKPLIAPERFARIALTAIRKAPALQEATVPSLLGAIMTCAQLGLEPSGPLGEAWLVPFKDNKTKTTECVLIIGYRGMIQLAMRSGMVASISARVVKDGDEFSYEFGSNEYIRHIPTDEPGEVTHAYATARLVTGGQPMVVLTRRQIDALRKRSRSSDRGPWVTDFDAMASKTALRQLFRWLPSSVEVQGALGADSGVVRGIPESIEDIPNVIDIPDLDDV